MNETLSLYLDMIRNPVRAALRIKETPSGALPLVLLLALQIPMVMLKRSEILAKSETFLSQHPMFGNGVVLYLLVTAVLLGVLFLSAGMVHIISHLFGGLTPFYPLWCSFLILTAWTALFNLVPLPGVAFLVTVWSFVVEAALIKALYGFTWGKSVGVSLLALIGIFVSVLLLALMFAYAMR